MPSWRVGLAVLVVALLCGCAQTTRQSAASPTMVFLTRDGCANTGTMRARLDEALRSLGRPATYQVIDADTLPASDPRRGYGTPTVLIGNRDLFGMPEQKTPDPPTCRLYPGGVPSVDAIVGQLKGPA